MISGKKYGVSLQALIILFSLIVVATPAVAIAPPIVLEGSLLVDGSPAVVGTEVTVVAEGQTVGETTVTNAGLFGDERSNRLGVSSDYSVVTIYVDGVETLTLDLSSYQAGEMVSLDLSATTPVAPTTTEEKSRSSGGGGGGFGSVTTTETAGEDIDMSESETPQTDETILESTVEEEVADEMPGEDMGEESSPVGGISMIAIFGLILVGIIVVSYGYRSKK